MSNYTIWGLVGPATWPWWLAALALASTLHVRLCRWSRGLLSAAVAAFVLMAVVPTGYWLAEPLERRFGAAKLDRSNPDHIVVLAGAERLAASARRGRLEVNGAAERIIEGAALAHAWPQARLWIVGGVRYRDLPTTDTEWTATAWRRLGIPSTQVIMVRDTLDTCANARGVALRKPTGTLLLVTSALHMPRALACFQAQGLHPLPYPVDYLNPSVDSWSQLFQSNLAANVERVDRALHEWLGLLLYRVQGRTTELLPAR